MDARSGNVLLDQRFFGIVQKVEQHMGKFVAIAGYAQALLGIESNLDPMDVQVRCDQVKNFADRLLQVKGHLPLIGSEKIPEIVDGRGHVQEKVIDLYHHLLPPLVDMPTIL